MTARPIVQGSLFYMLANERLGLAYLTCCLFGERLSALKSSCHQFFNLHRRGAHDMALMTEALWAVDLILLLNAHLDKHIQSQQH